MLSYLNISSFRPSSGREFYFGSRIQIWYRLYPAYVCEQNLFFYVNERTNVKNVESKDTFPPNCHVTKQIMIHKSNETLQNCVNFHED
jgi:hypothetical protein